MRDWYTVLNRSTSKQVDVRQELINHLQSNYTPVYIDQDPIADAQNTVYPSKIGAFDFFDPGEGPINLVVMRDPQSGALFAIEKAYIEEANNTKGQCRVVSPYSPGDILQIQR